ncbi:MAG: ABC transporter ATP-binding protein [Bacteroidales bacterium]|nr:ABC transporter ATP-binding protein [Bacteroidales bacterium]
MKTLLQALDMIRRCHPRSFWWRIFYVVLQSVLPLVNLYVLKMLVDGITTSTVPTILNCQLSILNLVVLYCLIFLLNRLVSILSGLNNDIMTQRLTDYLSDRMQQQSARLDMAYFDNPAYHDTFHRAQQEAAFRPLQILNGFMGLIGAVISIVGIVAMLATASWLIIVVMVVAVLPSFFVRLVKSKRLYAFRRESTQDYRRTSYYSALLGGRDFAKEMRTFGLSAYFRARYLEVRRRLVARLFAISRRLAAYDAVCAVVETAALFFIVMFLFMGTVKGSLTVGSFVMLFEAFRRGQSQLSTLVASVSVLYDNRLFIGNLFEFLDLEPRIVSPQDPVPFPEKVESVEFRDITFRYPDMDHDVLSHYSLIARAGEITRIEGQNGFGKTTLLKLLLRLYDTDGGQVLVNGIDVRRYDLKGLRRGIGAVFQDFVRFYATAAENIAFGQAMPADNLAAAPIANSQSPITNIRKAAEMAGADSFIERLPKGYDTQLGRMFDGGEDLSMGQWQRIALARQLYSDAPVLLFDEPTAWMDVPTREHFEKTLQSLKEQNKVIILIKHI